MQSHLIVGIGLICLLAYWLIKLGTSAGKEPSPMAASAKQAGDEAWARSMFSDFKLELEMQRANQELCIGANPELLKKTKQEATSMRDAHLGARNGSRSEAEMMRAAPIFNRAVFLMYENSLLNRLTEKRSGDEGRCQSLERVRNELLNSAENLLSQCKDNYLKIRMGRFYQGWDVYPSYVLSNAGLLRVENFESTSYQKYSYFRLRPNDLPQSFDDAWQGRCEGKTAQRVLFPAKSKGSDHIRFLIENGVDCLYHFTDSSNFSSIVNSGGLFSWSYCEESGIAIERPGGSPLSRELDARRGLEDYVRMGYSKDHPMLHAAKKDGRLVDPIVLEVDLRVLLLQSVLFSNRNATATGAEVGSDLDDLKKVRFDLIRSGRWANDDEKGLLQAEVLVLQAVPGYLIRRNGRLLRNPTKDEAASLSGLESATSSRG